MSRIVWPLAFAALLACEDRYEKNQPYQVPATASSSDALSDRILTPTNPDGGVIPGKLEPLDPEESNRRKTLNIAKPIEWGSSIAGISMSTPFSEASSTLSNVVGTSGPYVIYGESIAIAWMGGEPNLPFAIVAIDGYAGTLSLPAPIGGVKIGSDLSSHLGDYSNNQELIRALARTFDNQGSGYDCLAVNTCRLIDDGVGDIEFHFKTGFIFLDSENKISAVFSLLERSYPAPAVGDYIYGQSVAGFNLASTLPQTEERLGFAYRIIDNTGFYDSGNLAITWDGLLPGAIAARANFTGNIPIGNSINKKIGDSLTDVLDSPPANPDAVSDDDLINIHVPALIKKIERIYHSRANDYDCLNPAGDAAPTCQINDSDENVIFLNLPQGYFAVSRDGNLRLLVATLWAETTFEEEE